MVFEDLMSLENAVLVDFFAEWWCVGLCKAMKPFCVNGNNRDKALFVKRYDMITAD